MGEALELPDFAAAIRLQPDETGGGLQASPPPLLSNAAQRAEPKSGAPFGGYLAALCLEAVRKGLGSEAPLRTLTVQFLSGARFDEPVDFVPETLRGGRSTLFAQVRAFQAGKPILSTALTLGIGGSGPEHRPLEAAPPSYTELPTILLDPRIAPWFTRSVEYRFVGDPGILGGQDDTLVRVWMRVRAPGPLDDLKLSYLLDAVFPNFFLITGPIYATSVDMRYDLFQAIDPELSPEGWVYFEFRTADTSDGWAVEDGKAFAPDGRPIAVARQLRKVLARRG